MNVIPIVNPTANRNQYRLNNACRPPSFKGSMLVSDVILDDKSLLGGAKFRSVINKAVKMLKDVKNKNVDYIKEFWDLVSINDPSKAIQRSGRFIVQGEDAEYLSVLGSEIGRIGGDTEAYKDAAKDIKTSKKSRFRLPDGEEQNIVIKAHTGKKRSIEIDDIFFKPVGHRLSRSEMFSQSEAVERSGAVRKNQTEARFYTGPVIDYSDWPAVARKPKANELD